MKLSLKKAYDKLVRNSDKEEFFEQLKSLNFIDPFRYGWMMVVLFTILVFFGYYRAVFILSGIYLLWGFLYLITFYGVYVMWKGKKKK